MSYELMHGIFETAYRDWGPDGENWGPTPELKAYGSVEYKAISGGTLKEINDHLRKVMDNADLDNEMFLVSWQLNDFTNQRGDFAFPPDEWWPELRKFASMLAVAKHGVLAGAT